MNPWDLDNNLTDHLVENDGEIFIFEAIHHCPEDSDGSDWEKLILLSTHDDVT